MELGIKEVMLKVVDVYTPQVGKRTERGISEKVRCSCRECPWGERLTIEADFDGHVGEGSRGDELLVSMMLRKETWKDR